MTIIVPAHGSATVDLAVTIDPRRLARWRFSPASALGPSGLDAG
ncbi:MAG: hypothetical protein U1F43_38035 [Myxococcota bacterium]